MTEHPIDEQIDSAFATALDANQAIVQHSRLQRQNALALAEAAEFVANLYSQIADLYAEAAQAANELVGDSLVLEMGKFFGDDAEEEDDEDGISDAGVA